MNECEDCDRMDCRERGCIAPVSSEEIKRKALESSGRALWSAYCDKKMALEDAEERIEALEAALHRISLGSQDSGTTKESLGREARRALENKQ